MKYVTVQPLNGGMSIGYERVFGPPEYIISNNDSNDPFYLDYCEKRNFFSKGKTKLIKMDWDLTEAESEYKNNLEKLLSEDIDVVSYVPICAGLSTLNKSKDKDKKRFSENNNQNQNMYNTTKFILNKIKPKCAVMENAPALYTKIGTSVRNRIIDIAKNSGYKVTFEYTSTLYHGIPHSRKRTFVYFWNANTSFIPKFEHKECKNIAEYLKEIPENAKGQDYYMGDLNKDVCFDFVKDKFNIKSIKDFIEIIDSPPVVSANRIVWNLDLFDELFEWTHKNKNSLTETKFKRGLHISEYQKYKKSIGKMFYDNSVRCPFHRLYTPTLTGLSGLYILHPEKLRVLNTRELMHLMGLPNDYWNDKIVKNESQGIFQSVPTTTAEYTANNVMAYLKNELKPIDLDVVMANNVKMQVENIKDVKLLKCKNIF